MDLKPLITLLAIVNPLAIVPFFIHYTQDFSPAQRRRTLGVGVVQRCFTTVVAYRIQRQMAGDAVDPAPRRPACRVEAGGAGPDAALPDAGRG